MASCQPNRVYKHVCDFEQISIELESSVSASLKTPIARNHVGVCNFADQSPWLNYTRIKEPEPGFSPYELNGTI